MQYLLFKKPSQHTRQSGKAQLGQFKLKDLAKIDISCFGIFWCVRQVFGWEMSNVITMLTF